MHIAVCDDNVADRKQMERLLKREAEKRISDSYIFYTDSYGNANALLSNPMQYDAFFIDICKTEGITGVDVAKALVEKGVKAPIIMCCSSINYRDYQFAANTFFLNKPIKVDELSSSIDHAESLKEKALPLIELRQEVNTIYVTEPEILYAVSQKRELLVCLTDGRKISISSTAHNFFSQVENYPSFFEPSNKIVVNGRHIQSIEHGKATMIDGTKFKISSHCLKYAEYAFEEFHGESTFEPLPTQ